MSIKTIINTFKNLKVRQILYKIYSLLRNHYRNKVGFKYKLLKSSKSCLVNLQEYIFTDNKYTPPKEFIFLNKKKKFKEIDWNFKEYGKLWTYNLNYFDFLKQKNISKDDGINLIKDFLSKIDSIKDGLEPYPISLRGINWIKFLSKHDISDKLINDSLYAQYYILLDNLEYHLLGNHLLENGFSLLFGAYYFRDETLYKKAKNILTEELEEQILSDGAHFELSPMYHQILLDRLLDSINLVKNNNWKNYELLEFLEEKAKLMLSWLENITFSNGNIPLLNDSAFGIAPNTAELLDYANRLGIKYKTIPLGESGYRYIKKGKYEIVLDVADVKASYIPGHTHADTFTFELYVDGKPVIVDTGVSTYENNERRFYERSTKAHNTLEIENTNSSEVWGSFRLGDRAKIVFIEEIKNKYIKAIHDGYKKKFNSYHQREFILNENEIIIKDEIKGNAGVNAKIYLHFHPDLVILRKDSKILINKNIIVEFDKKFFVKNYSYAFGFNKLKEGKVLEVPFKGGLECRIKITN